MPRKIIRTFEIEYLSILDEQGNVDTQIPVDLSEDQLKEIYHLMVLTRTFDDKLFKLQRSGKLGTLAQNKGQEACQVGSAMALQEDDWVVPSFRELGVFLTRKADMARIVQGWNGDARAYTGHSHNLPMAVPIGSQCLHAAGVAWAEKLKKTNNAVLVFFGDGATSEGDVHEAMNFAADFNLPVVFFCQNNGWAISIPRENQMHNETIAQRAIAYGMAGIQVDGNDVLAVYKATQEALERARNGQGPTLIEGLTYRMGDHTTSDDSAKYRDPELLKSWIEKDPLLRLKKYFEKLGTWNDEYGNWVAQTVEKEVDTAVEQGLAVPPPPPENLFEHIYSKMTPDLQAQLASLKDELQGGMK